MCVSACVGASLALELPFAALQIGGTTAFFCGTQARPGAPLDVDLSDPAAAGMIDWGSFAPAGNGQSGVAGLTGSNDGPYKMVVLCVGRIEVPARAA